MAQVVDRVVARQRSYTISGYDDLKAIAAIAPCDIVMHQIEPRCGLDHETRSDVVLGDLPRDVAHLLGPEPRAILLGPIPDEATRLDTHEPEGSVAERDVSDERDIRVDGLRRSRSPCGATPREPRRARPLGGRSVRPARPRPSRL